MTQFRERDLLKVTKDGSSRWNGDISLTEGMIVRVVEVSPEGKLVKIQSSLLDDNHLSAWWDVNRFELHEAALPVQPRPEALTGRDRARELLNEAETKRRQGEGYQRVQTPILLGILYTLLAEPERVTDTTGRDIAPRDMARQIDELQTVRRALQTRVDELSEKTDILDTANRDLRIQLNALKIDKRAALEEIDRLNRVRGVVPTRAEAVAPKVTGVEVKGNQIVISDADGDQVEFELCRAGDPVGPKLFVSGASSEGAYIDPEQFEALSQNYRRWIQQQGG